MAMTLITTNPDSTDVASVTFDSGIDSTYKLYIFKFINVNPATDNVTFFFKANAAGGSGYNETITSTMFRAYHYESGSSTALGYQTSYHQSQDAAYQPIGYAIGDDADGSLAGELHLFNPSGTTYVKHFYATTSVMSSGTTYSLATWTGGYFNTTSAIDDINFKMSSGNMDGVIKLYGVA